MLTNSNTLDYHARGPEFDSWLRQGYLCCCFFGPKTFNCHKILQFLFAMLIKLAYS